MGFEPVRMRRRRLAYHVRPLYLLRYRNFPQKGTSNSADKDYSHHITLCIGVHMYYFLQFSMNYALSLGSGSDSRLFSHTGDIIHVFLAHLSRRLKGELIVYRSIRRPCISASVRKHFQTRISPQPVGQS